MAGRYQKANYIKAARALIHFGQERDYEEALVLCPFIEDSKIVTTKEKKREPLPMPFIEQETIKAPSIKLPLDATPEITNEEFLAKNQPELALDTKPEPALEGAYEIKKHNNSPDSSSLERKGEPRGFLYDLDEFLDNLTNW